MKKLVFLLIAFFLFSSHDMYLKLDSYFLEPNHSAIIKLYNGTFDLSENTIDRNRMLDVSLVGNEKRLKVDTSQWSEQNGATILNISNTEEGTWVAGVSTRPRNIEMTANDFNKYLKNDGVLDMLDWREKNDALDQDAVEKYSKHVKTIFQVGERKTDDWKVKLDYPIEFVPLSNPYELETGDELTVQLLWQGNPLTDQLVYMGSSQSLHSHDHDHGNKGDNDEHSQDHDHEEIQTDDHQHDSLQQFRTDDQGLLKMKIDDEGVWYLRTIYLELSEEDGLTHESNWATLTFEVGHGHSHHSHGHSHHSQDGEDGHHHHDDPSQGIPVYIYWIGSFLLLGILFYWFNRKSE